jgi:aryl-alcohol dehydrogenase-like predicted oxidoreductase
LPQSATDCVRIGKTGITASLIGIGTGSNGWGNASNQTRLGHDAFTAMVRHAFDRGITFFDCADMYGSHTYLREAIRGLPRDQFVIQSKSTSRTPAELRADIDRFRTELGVDYIDSLLMHCVTEPDWNTRYQATKDALSELREQGIIRAHGCSCHSLVALEAASHDPWVQVDLARFNPWGKHMDNREGEPEENAPTHVEPVLRRMRQSGVGVLGMKILAQGDMLRNADKRDHARNTLTFALRSGVLDGMVIGFESSAEIDEILDITDNVLAELR